MADVQIKYVNKSGNHHEHITQLGNDQGTWKVDDVVRWIDDKEHTFFTQEAGRRADIEVRQGTRRKYVQTHADQVWQNNLLALPPCRFVAA